MGGKYMKKIKIFCLILVLILITGISSACTPSEKGGNTSASSAENTMKTVISDFKFNFDQYYWSVGVDVLDKNGNVLSKEEAEKYVERVYVPDLEWYYDNNLLVPYMSNTTSGAERATTSLLIPRWKMWFPQVITEFI